MCVSAATARRTTLFSVCTACSVGPSRNCARTRAGLSGRKSHGRSHCTPQQAHAQLLVIPLGQGDKTEAQIKDDRPKWLAASATRLQPCQHAQVWLMLLHARCSYMLGAAGAPRRYGGGTRLQLALDGRQHIVPWSRGFRVLLSYASQG